MFIVNYNKHYFCFYNEQNTIRCSKLNQSGHRMEGEEEEEEEEAGNPLNRGLFSSTKLSHIDIVLTESGIPLPYTTFQHLN